MKLFSQALSNKYLNMRKAMTPPMLGMREDSISEQNLPIVPPSRGGGMLPAPQESEDEQQKRGLFSSIGNVLNKPTDNLDEQDDTGFDDLDKKYGLKKPEIKKESVFSKIMAYALPTLLTAADGRGILPGLAGAYMGRKIGKARAEEKALDRYQTGRKEAIGLEKEYRTIRRQEARDKAIDDYRNKSLDAMGGYRDDMLDLQRARLEAQQAKDAAAAQVKDLKSTQKKILPAAKVEVLADGSNLPSVLDRLKNTIETNADSFGPIVGRLNKLNPYDRTTQQIRAQTDTVRQIVGKFLEGGVLRREDELKYQKMLAEIDNTPETALDKIENMRTELNAKYKSYLKAYDKAGYDVSEFMNDPMQDDNGEEIDQGDEQALEWARSHPDDPRAQEILRMHGVQ